MAPVKDTASSEDSDMLLILSAVAACEEFTLKPQAVAKAVGISHANHVYPKLHKILAKHGYKYENKRIVKSDPDSAADETTVATPVKKSGGKKKGAEGTEVGSDGATPSKTPKKTKAKATPTPKKRKLQDTESMEDGDEVTNGDGAVEA